MRVLIVTTPLPAPGRPNTMAPLQRQIKSLRDIGVELEVLEMHGRSGVKYLRTWPRFLSLARTVDLVHAHFGYCGWLGRMQFQKPLVVSFMGSDLLGAIDREHNVKPVSKVVVQINRWFSRTVDSVIVKSSEMADVLRPVRAEVVPNGVDLDDFRPIDQHEAKSALGWDPDKRYILFPGNPRNPRKGFPLAQATVDVAARQIGEELELVPLRRVPADQVPLYMNACQAMIMASHIEGSPNVVKEAMACNLPTVSVPVGDVTELLSGVERCSVHPRDPDALGTSLAVLLREGRRSGGREAVLRKGLDLKSIAHRIYGIYSALLEERSNSKRKVADVVNSPTDHR